jgi:ubiquinone biosynthesis protein UbiJ
MSICLNKLFKEINSLSPVLIKKIEDLYPINFNVEISTLPNFSLTLSSDYQKLNFFRHGDPQFSLRLDIFEALNALKNKQIPTKSILGDTETALVFFGALANSSIDIELLIYKYFGDIPALILRKMLIQSQEKESTNNNQINELLKSFRDISIRLDRIEQALLNG